MIAGQSGRRSRFRSRKFLTNSCKTRDTLVLLDAIALVSIVLEEAFLRWEVVVPTEFAAEGGRSIPWFGSFHANREGGVGRSLVGCGCYGIRCSLRNGMKGRIVTPEGCVGAGVGGQWVGR